MLENIGKLGGLLGQQQQRSTHPLADPKELRRILAALPMDNAFKALDELGGWLESIAGLDDLEGVEFFRVACQLDEAGQWHELWLGREYLQARRFSKADEKRLWEVVYRFWSFAAACYERCLNRLNGKDKTAEALRAELPLLASRAIRSLGFAMKWERFRYAPTEDSAWLRLGSAYAAAERAGVATRPVSLYPKIPGRSSVQQEYLKVLALHTSSIDRLLPAEIELAERLTAHFANNFVFGPESSAASVYWVDLARAQPPMRLAREPELMLPSLRFFHPGPAYERLSQLLADLERGVSLSPDINLGNQYHPRAVLPVLHHLIACWAPLPPQRRHARHPVRHRMSVLPGLPKVVNLLGRSGGEPAGVESWMVENVSRGGFGAVIESDGENENGIKVGTLLAMQPEGGDNWLLGAVRRYLRDSSNAARVGIMTLSRRVTLIQVRPQRASGYVTETGTPALWMRDEETAGELRLVLPLNAFDLRENVEFHHDGVIHMLTPVALVEQTADFEIARYRPMAS